MAKEHYYRQWQDPTADVAINLADMRGQRNLSSIKGLFEFGQKLSSPQVQAEREIHTYRMQLAQGVINRAVYRAKVTLSRSSLKQEGRRKT